MSVKKKVVPILLLILIIIAAALAVWFIPAGGQKSLMSESLAMSREVIAGMGTL